MKILILLLMVCAASVASAQKDPRNKVILKVEDSTFKTEQKKIEEAIALTGIDRPKTGTDWVSMEKVIGTTTNVIWVWCAWREQCPLLDKDTEAKILAILTDAGVVVEPDIKTLSDAEKKHDWKDKPMPIEISASP